MQHACCAPRADTEEQRVIAARLDVAVRSGRLVDWRALLAFISGHRRSLMRRLRLIPTKLTARLALIDDRATVERVDEAKDHSADHGNGQRSRRSGGAETETGNRAPRGKAGTGAGFE
jgi:hypothetical protein